MLYSERFAFMVYISDAEYLRSKGKAPGSRFVDMVRLKTARSNVDVESIIENVVEKGGLIRR